MRKKLFFLLAACFFLHCGSDDYDFSCLKILDENGQALGLYGCDQTDDWGPLELNAKERDLLSFADTVSLSGTTSAPVAELIAFPNPVRPGGQLGFAVATTSSSPSLKVKIVIVDELFRVKDQFALRLDGSPVFTIQIPADKYTAGEFYRVYYSVSAEGSENFFEGGGNFLVCDAVAVVSDLDKCK